MTPHSTSSELRYQRITTGVPQLNRDQVSVLLLTGFGRQAMALERLAGETEPELPCHIR